MINIYFFAKYKEIFGSNVLQFAIDEPISINDLKIKLCSEHKNIIDIVVNNQCITAVNKSIIEKNIMVYDGDEVAFFPPVSGG